MRRFGPKLRGRLVATLVAFLILLAFIGGINSNAAAAATAAPNSGTSLTLPTAAQWSDLHGVNYGFNCAPCGFLTPNATISFPAIAADGFNLVRFAWYWNAYAADPSAYIADLQKVAWTAEHDGLYIEFNMQDYDTGPQYGGEGFPASVTAGYSTQVQFWTAWYANKVVVDGTDGWDAYLAAWQAVITAVDNYTSVIGYEPMNEPTIYNSTSSTANALGQTNEFLQLGTLQTYLASHMRTMTSKWILFARPYIDPGCVTGTAELDCSSSGLPSPAQIVDAAPNITQAKAEGWGTINNVVFAPHRYSLPYSGYLSRFTSAQSELEAKYGSVEPLVPVMIGEWAIVGYSDSTWNSNETNFISWQIGNMSAAGFAWTYEGWSEGAIIPQSTSGSYEHLLNTAVTTYSTSDSTCASIMEFGANCPLTVNQWELDTYLSQVINAVYGKTTTTSSSTSSTSSTSTSTVGGGLAIDGSGGCAAGSAASCTITFSTSNPNDLIYVVETGSSDTPATPTSTAATFAAMYSSAYEIPGGGYMNAYSGIWSSSGSITVTCKWSPTNNGNGCIAFAVSGSSGTFDPNAAIPCKNSGSGTSSSCTISTSNTNDILLGCVLTSGGATFTVGSGFTLIHTVTQSYAYYASCEDKVVSSTQSSSGVGYSSFGGSSYNWGQFAVAIEATAATTTSTTVSSTATSTATSPAIDGSGGCAAGSAASCTITFSTSNPNDLIYVVETGSSDTPATPTSTSVAFTPEYSSAYEAPGGGYMNAYSGIWSSSGSITVTCKWSPTNNGNGCIAFAVSGSSGTFDPNAAIPCKNSGTGTTSSCTISTSNSDDIILGCTLTEGGATFTVGSGFTLIHTVTQSYAYYASCEDKVVTATQSNLAVGYSFGGSSYNWGQFAVAIEAK